jgi:hypothetical protein
MERNHQKSHGKEFHEFRTPKITQEESQKETQEERITNSHAKRITKNHAEAITTKSHGRNLEKIPGKMNTDEPARQRQKSRGKLQLNQGQEFNSLYCLVMHHSCLP